MFPKLFLRKNSSIDREKLLGFETEGQEFANFLEHNNNEKSEQFLKENGVFLSFSCRFLGSNIELLNNKFHELSPSGGFVSPSGGFESLLFDQGVP